MADFDKKNQSKEKPVPVTHVQRLMDIINNRRDNHIKHPIGLPDHPQEAAKTWINFLEPRSSTEIVDNIKDPYQERIADCLTIYYKLSHADQRYLQELRSRGIYWRGDSIKFMQTRVSVKPEQIEMIKRIGLAQALSSIRG